MKHVFIFGAGASQELGGPLMADFLDRAEDLKRKGRVDGDAFDLVFRGLDQLQMAHSKAVLDLRNVESVMAAFEMAALVGRLGSLSPDDVAQLPKAITTVVAQTVEESVKFAPNSAGGVKLAGPYQGLSDYLGRLVEAGEQVALLTFNYDLALDLVVLRMGATPDYGLVANHAGPLPLLKLHGSLGWTTTTNGEIHPVSIDRLSQDSPRVVGDNHVPFRTLQKLKYKETLTGEPVIVPPTWAKTGYFDKIKNVWTRAARELSEAESILVFGYSLPESDHFFRLLYALGTVGKTRLRRFWVFDKDDSGLIRDRFEAILGQAARGRFAYHSSNFNYAVATVPGLLAAEGVGHQKR